MLQTPHFGGYAIIHVDRSRNRALGNTEQSCIRCRNVRYVYLKININLYTFRLKIEINYTRKG